MGIINNIIVHLANVYLHWYIMKITENVTYTLTVHFNTYLHIITAFKEKTPFKIQINKSMKLSD